MSMKHTLFSRLLLFAMAFPVMAGARTDCGWWPEQRVPKRVSVCARPVTAAEAVLAQSLSGLAARAVHEGRSERMVWIERGGMYGLWLDRTLHDHRIRNVEQTEVWRLLESMVRSGEVKGYVLYAAGDGSLNPATVRASLTDGVLVEERLRPRVEALGLSLLYDARGESPQRCWRATREHLNRHLVVSMNPSLAFNRDLAIAHRSMVHYGVDSLYEEILSSMEPISPVVGWNAGPESGHVAPPARYGLFNTASDYCSNLPLLSAGSAEAELLQVKHVDPRRIDFSQGGSYHSFVMSDGDNMQWTMDGFFSRDYYLSPDVREFAMNWTTCAANMSQAGPVVWNELVRRQRADATLVEFGGGYQYVDCYGSGRPDRWELLRRYARQTGAHMRRTGVRVLNLMALHDVGSEESLRAYRIYAEEIEDLIGIIAIQYNPYHGGNGAVYWVKNRAGVDIPVVTARYSLWGKVSGPGFGGPEQTARRIDADAAGGESLGWTVVHAWSRYRRNSSGAIVDAEDSDRTASRGVKAVSWCVERLTSPTQVVSLEELLWRIRMKHDPETTRAIIDKL